MKVVKFYPVNATHGYAIVQNLRDYGIAFVKNTAAGYVREANSFSNGKPHSYESPFVADYALRKEILPLYKKETA